MFLKLFLKCLLSLHSIYIFTNISNVNLKHIKHILPILAILAIGLSSCNKSEKTNETVTSEHINYNIIYLEDKAGDIPTNLLPDIMESYYTKHYVQLKIEGFFGQFSLIQVANLKKQTVTSMLNFFGNKIYHVGKKGELPVGVKELLNPEFNFTNDTSTICGLPSHKAIVTTANDTYNIHYTKQFDIKNPNFATPYRSINYVLSDFRVELSALNMRLVAKQHENLSVDTSIFDVPEDYKEVSKDTMERIINSLFTKE